MGGKSSYRVDSLVWMIGKEGWGDSMERALNAINSEVVCYFFKHKITRSCT